MPTSDMKGKILEFFKEASKDEILDLVYELFVEGETEKEARADLLCVTEKLLGITVRYLEFRIRELTDRGLLLNHSYSLEKFWDGIKLTLEIKFGKDTVMDLAKWLEYIKKGRMSDAQVKKTLLRRADFVSKETEEGVREFEHPKDKYTEEAEKVREELIERIRKGSV